MYGIGDSVVEVTDLRGFGVGVRWIARDVFVAFVGVNASGGGVVARWRDGSKFNLSILLSSALSESRFWDWLLSLGRGRVTFTYWLVETLPSLPWWVGDCASGP